MPTQDEMNMVMHRPPSPEEERQLERMRQALELNEKKMRLIIIRQFVAQVNELAEKNIEQTGKLEGSHYAAMTKLLGDLEKEIEDALR